MYLQILKVIEETQWRGRFQKQQADNGIYNARDLTPQPQMENTTEGEAIEQNPSVR